MLRPGVMARLMLTITSISAALTLAGCTALTSHVDGPVIGITDSGGDSNASATRGTLAMTKGCLMLGNAVLVWSDDTSWDPDTSEVVLADGTRLGIGDEIIAGGDPLDDLSGALGNDGADAAEACGGVGAEPGQDNPDQGRAVLGGGGPAQHPATQTPLSPAVRSTALPPQNAHHTGRARNAGRTVTPQSPERAVMLDVWVIGDLLAAEVHRS